MNVNEILAQVYEDIMHLLARPYVTPSMARAWYTHIVSVRISRDTCYFSGMVSQAAIDDPSQALVREHFKRIQTTLTQLIQRHYESGIRDADEFVQTVIECEQVHIVTNRENYDARVAKGDYTKAGIQLVSWSDIPPETRAIIWKKVLHGKVANANQFV